MKEYNKSTILKFGKYKGKTLIEVSKINIYYINWCLINLEHFYIGINDIEDIKIDVPNLYISDEAFEILSHKKKANTSKQRIRHTKPYDYNDIDEMDYMNERVDKDSWSKITWREAFDGVPDAIWNVD